MIYLIDDTPIEQLYRFLKVEDFNDVLERIDNLSADDVPSLSGASCVLIHSSYRDAMVKRQVLSVLDGGIIAPVVLFSDGDREKAEFGGENYIISIKKSILYSRLPKFLRLFRKTGKVNLKVLSGEEEIGKESKAIKSVGNVFSDFFSKVAIEIDPEPTQQKQGPRPYCLGREGMSGIARSIDGEFIKVNASALNDSKLRETDKLIHDFMTNVFCHEVRMLVLDLDADPQLYMRVALHFRLSDFMIGRSKYSPIIFISDRTLDKVLKYSPESQIFMTESVYMCRRSDLSVRLNLFRPLDDNTYIIDFLERISIPTPEGSNHSIANQWGASRLFMILNRGNVPKDTFKDFQDIHKELYFKYVIHRITTGYEATVSKNDAFRIRGASGKHILLIDDEANKGWAKTISALFPFSRFNSKEDVISERVMDYDSLSEAAKMKIEHGIYDLILLDLRLGGITEDDSVIPEEMSGYKVLRRIKALNRGVQVIVMTASNKAWNLKAIMAPKDCPDEGADGYFVKESPEYEFSDALSSANLHSFISDIESCFEKGFLRDYWSLIKSLSRSTDFMVEVAKQLEISYNMTANAKTEEGYHYAYLALYLVLEIISSELTKWIPNIGDTKLDSKLLQLDNGELCRAIVYPKGEEVIYRQKPFAHHIVKGTFPQKDKLAAIYLQLGRNQDHGMLFITEQLVSIRNAIIHPENRIDYDMVAPMKESAVLGSTYFVNPNYVFGAEEIKPLYREAAFGKVLYTDANKRPILHKGIAGTSLGVRFLLEVVKVFLSIISHE